MKEIYLKENSASALPLKIRITPSLLIRTKSKIKVRP
jgi:hypothetical protein